MNINAFQVNPLGVNCYVAHDSTGEGVIIDCGCSTESEWSEVKKYLAAQNITVKHLLCTHLHFDHVWGNAFVLRDLGLHPEASALDNDMYQHTEDMVYRSFHCRIPFPNLPPVERFLSDGDIVTFGNTQLQVIATPGHSRGSVCFYCEAEDVLFSGDTMFRDSMGRTDLDGGSSEDMDRSLKRLVSTLPSATNVLCGHGPYTTIMHESNYYV